MLYASSCGTKQILPSGCYCVAFLTSIHRLHAGLRVGTGVGRQGPQLLHHFDHLLLDAEEAWPALAPDVVLQLGARLTSKRAAHFLEWAVQGAPDSAR